jgi:hypothetical protein
LASYFEAALRPFPTHEDRPTRVIVSDTTATVEITFTGLLANGAEIVFDAVDVFDFNERWEITSLTSWYDSHAVRTAVAKARDDSNGDDS